MRQHSKNTPKDLSDINIDKFRQYKIYYYFAIITAHLVITYIFGVSMGFINTLAYLFIGIISSEALLSNHSRKPYTDDNATKYQLLKYPSRFLTAMPIIFNFIFIMPMVLDDLSPKESELSSANGLVVNTKDTNNQYLFLKKGEDNSSYNMNYQKNMIDYRKIPPSVYGKEVAVKYFQNSSGDFQNSDLLIYEIRGKDKIYLDYESQISYYKWIKNKSIVYTIIGCLLYLISGKFTLNYFIKFLRSK